MPTFHTESSGTGSHSPTFREDARRIIRRCVGATDEHAVILTGNGPPVRSTHKPGARCIHIPAVSTNRYHLIDSTPPGERPVVFIGPFEHHSNELPWRGVDC